MPRQYNLVLFTAYNGLDPISSWSNEADYLQARAFLKALVGGPHRVSSGRIAGAEIYNVPTWTQHEAFIKFSEQLRKANPNRGRFDTLTDMEVYCAFSGISMSIPYRTVENYQLARALALQLLGPAGRAATDEGEMFFPETREQLDALFALQRKLKVKREG